jgi:hypothetical protein
MLTLTKAAVTATAVALTCMGASRANDTAATGADGAGGPPGVASSVDQVSPGGTQTAAIHDPVLDMDAETVTYPAKWHFQGTLLQGTPCNGAALVVYRVFSPDGLTEIEKLPTFNWYWSNMPNPPKPPDGCLPLKEAMSAKDFLKYISAILKVEYVGEQSVPAATVAKFDKESAESDETWAKKYIAAGMTPPTNTGELADATVRYKNGTFPMEGRLDATVQCSGSHRTINTVVADRFTTRSVEEHTCRANIRYLHAPEAQFKAVEAKTDDAITETTNMQWANAYMAKQSQQTQQAITSMRQQTQQAMAAQQQQFNQGQAMRQRQNNEFIATMQHGTDMSMQQAAQIANTNHTIASDWVDYSLDQQTVRDPSTGQVSKVSSASSYTWIDASGKTSFQTNDPNANPNGTLQGTWTRQQKVHGDGSN